MNYINKYEDAQAIQDALDAGTLANPYVALNEDSGELDFNSLTPYVSPVPSTGAWILTSDGDLIDGVYDPDNEGGDYYRFIFSASTAATFTIYLDGSVVNTDQIDISYVSQIPGGDTCEQAQLHDLDYAAEDIPVIYDSGWVEYLADVYADISLDLSFDNGEYTNGWFHGEILFYGEFSCGGGETMGVWGDDGEGNYTFQITETDQSYWNDTYIGTINSIEYAGSTDAAEILLTPGADAGSWDMKIHQENGSETIEETFEEGTDYLWNDSGFMVDSGDSDSTLQVYWDGAGSFTFNSGSYENPLSISTSDPGYPE